MRLSEALQKIHAPKGQSSIIAGLMSGNLSPIQGQNAVGKSLKEAEEKLEHYNNLQANATSDWAYWGYAGDVAYWDCVVNLLKAAEKVGADNLPNVPEPNISGIVMDVQANLQRWGRKIYNLAAEYAEAEANYKSDHEDNWRGD